MTAYNPPIQDMHFLLTEVLGFEHDELDSETVEAVLGEAAKLASEVLAPLNKVGDENGAKLDGDAVTTAPGFKDAYQQYCEGGWNAVPFDPEHGGQGLPWALAFPIQEMWQGANMSFGLCPLLNQGAIKAITAHGTDEQKEFYLAKLISGEWTGTMNLTEPQAGSDLGLLRSKAEKQDDGSYKISGQKIFITYGEHDFTDNIIHLVLARLPEAPEDVKGISLFVVPKVMEGGARNAVQCIGLEHKLGIHASPTCTMEFDGATGYLLGGENEGLKCMFTMMNNARLSVGLQGVAIAEASYQAARDFAQERVQGKSFSSGERVAIAEHADVQRMLMSMRAKTEAGRALTYDAAIALDQAMAGDAAAQAKVDLLTPLVKSWCTDMACDVTSTGIQVFGGMGFIEETGAAQYYRDARILPIYEGTNGIQASDLVFRKIIHDDGNAAEVYIDELEASVPDSNKGSFSSSLSALRDSTEGLLKLADDKNMDGASAVSVPYLNGFAIIAGGVLLARSAAVAEGKGDEIFYKDKIETAQFYIANILQHAKSWLEVSSQNK
ncbi:MAG: acyl-CoA dehydrogenase [Micavibrio sp.]|nr:MAG: acyl-CoA dehydrogenase [Micavibrio sp.]